MKCAEGKQESWLETIRQYSNSPARFQIVRVAELIAIEAEVLMQDQDIAFKDAFKKAKELNLNVYMVCSSKVPDILDILRKHWYYGPQIPTIKGEEDASTNPTDTDGTNVPAGFSKEHEQSFIPNKSGLNKSGSGNKKDR